MDRSGQRVLVTGATGRQGGAVVDHLLAAGFPVRALTRDPSKPAGQALAKKGVDVVKGDQEDEASLDAALAGCWGLFSVQNFWEKGVGYEGEVRQGKRLLDAAKRAGVQHVVQASVSTDAGNREDETPMHFQPKYVLERYLAEIGLPFTAIRTVFFMENFLDPQASGGRVLPVLRGSLASGQKLHMVACDDIGAAVTAVFEAPERFRGAKVNVASDVVSVDEMAAAWSKVVGKAAPGWWVPNLVIRLMNGEFAHQLRWNRSPGWTFPLDEGRAVLPNPTSFEAFLQKHRDELAR